MHSFSEFQIDRQVCEVRIPQNYLFWDYSGRLWAEIARDFEKMKAVNANPNHTSFEAGDFLLVAEPSVIRITARGTVSNDEFLKKSSVFFDTCIDILKIALFDRVGLRIIWTQEFRSMRETKEGFEKFGVLALPAGPLFGIEEPPVGLETRISWESANIGVVLGLRTERRSFEPQLPWELRSQVKATGSEQFLLVVDADRFTRKSLSREVLDISEWIGSSHRVLKKSITKEFFK